MSRGFLRQSGVVLVACAVALQASAFQPTDGNLYAAVSDWISNSTSAESTYGHISTWDMSLITAMSYLFVAKTTFNDDISSWNVSGVTDMGYMFAYATSFNQDISSWDVGSVTAMYGMFNEASSFNQDISSWNVASVTTMAAMFSKASAFNYTMCWDLSGIASGSTPSYTGIKDGPRFSKYNETNSTCECLPNAVFVPDPNTRGTCQSAPVACIKEASLNDPAPAAAELSPSSLRRLMSFGLRGGIYNTLTAAAVDNKTSHDHDGENVKKPKPKAKPKPKTSTNHNSAPSLTPICDHLSDAVGDVTLDYDATSKADDVSGIHVGQTQAGQFVAVFCGIAIACVVAIALVFVKGKSSVLKQSHHPAEHELLPLDSERSQCK